MKNQWIAVIGSGALVLGVALAGVGFAGSDGGKIQNGTIRVEKRSEAEYPAMATISVGQAMRKAVESAPGQVLKVELEGEDGFLVYGVEVVAPDKTITDVKLDAGSGEVLAMSRDKADREDHEKGDRENGEHEDEDGED